MCWALDTALHCMVKYLHVYMLEMWTRGLSKLSWVALLYCFLVSKFVHKSRYVYDKRLRGYRDKSFIFIKGCLQWRKRSFYALAHVNFLFTNLQNSFSWLLYFGCDACVHALLFFILYFYDVIQALVLWFTWKSMYSPHPLLQLNVCSEFSSSNWFTMRFSWCTKVNECVRWV